MSKRTQGEAKGRIVTFFSYKGGVGRTMALANVGFIAAMSGARVLLMDWDLEAPGLPYYFRGLIDPVGAGAIRKAPGVLDLFWGWRQAVTSARSPDDLDERTRPYLSHRIFERCTRPLLDKARLPKQARLDLISAGAQTISCPSPTSYADALSMFNWTEFFEQAAGGAMLEAMRTWCKQNYDLILVDSRTGLADVAGICTLQIPDTVLLSFIFNRQNIEGIAQVTKSIVSVRGDEVVVRVAPMRVSKERPTEEADARAHAARELKRAGLEQQRLERDLNLLAIPTSPIPYYESLAPFTSSEFSTGDLNWAYLRLTHELTGREIMPLRLDPAWAEEVRRRLQPAITTIEYLRDLENADPDRAAAEIERYLDGAREADPSVSLDTDYIRALIAATIDLLSSDWDASDQQIRALEEKTLSLIEQMHALGEEDWRADFADTSEEFGFRVLHDMRTEIARLDRLMAILQIGPQTGEILLQRASTLLVMARYNRDLGDYRRMMDEVRNVEHILDEIGEDDTDVDEVKYVHASIADLRARTELESNPEQAMRQFTFLFDLAYQSSDSRIHNFAAEAHLTLAERTSDLAEKRAHLRGAIGLQPRLVIRDIDRFAQVVKILLEDDNPVEVALEIDAALFSNERLIRSLPYGRSTGTALTFGRIAGQLLRAVAGAPPERIARLIRHLSEASSRILAAWTVRLNKGHRDPSDHDKPASLMITVYENLVDRLQLAGLDSRSVTRLRERIADAKEAEASSAT